MYRRSRSENINHVKLTLLPIYIPFHHPLSIYISRSQNPIKMHKTKRRNHLSLAHASPAPSSSPPADSADTHGCSGIRSSCSHGTCWESGSGSAPPSPPLAAGRTAASAAWPAHSRVRRGLWARWSSLARGPCLRRFCGGGGRAGRRR